MPFSYEEQLRLLGSEIFEELAAQLVKHEHPSARHVRGSGGDGGLDVYTGSLDGAPAKEPLRVWQVKFFRDGIGEKQKPQVLKSLRTVLPRKPVAWTLIVPVNLTPAALRWFEEKIREAHPEIASITLWQADEVLARMRAASLIDLYLLRPREEIAEEAVARVLTRLDDFVPVATLLQSARTSVEQEPKTAEAFYRGTVPDWRDIVSDFDAPREGTGALWRWIASCASRPPATNMAVLLGRSGEGKSTILMRAAAELVAQEHAVVLYHKEDRDTLSAEQFAELLPGTTCFLIIDRLTRFAPEVLHGFIERLHRMPLRVIIAGASVRGDVQLGDLAELSTIDVDRLSDEEIEGILQKLRADPAYLGTLAGLSPEEQRERFRGKAGRQLLVAMLEIHGGVPFEAHVQRELAEIERRSRDARRAVGYICAMHRFDIPMSPAMLQRLVPGLVVSEMLRDASGMIQQRRSELLVSRHALWAESVMRSERDPAERYCEIVRAAQDSESRIIARMLHLLSLRDRANVRKPLDQAAERFPTNGALWLAQAAVARARGDVETARSMYRRAVNVHSSQAVAYSAWGSFERQQGNFGTRGNPEPDTARWLFARSVQMNPENVHAWNEWAVLEAAASGLGPADEPYSARWLFRKGFDFVPEHVPNLSAWGAAEARADNLGDLVNPERFTARWLFGRAFEIESRDIHLLHSWANAEARAGNLGSTANPEAFTARWLFHRITSLAPRDVAAWTAWAVCERRANNIGRDDESDEGTARWLFAKALAIRENMETLTAAADMEQHDCRNIARAEKYYLRAAAATRHEKTRARIYFDLGMAFSRMSENEKAVTYLTEAVKIFPNDHIIHAKLGRSHAFLHNNALAEYHFQRALEIKPSDTKTQAWYQNFLRATRHKPERTRV